MAGASAQGILATKQLLLEAHPTLNLRHLHTFAHTFHVCLLALYSCSMYL